MAEKLNVKIKRVNESAIIPSYAREGDAGVDIYSNEDYVLKPGERKLVKTGIKIAIPFGYEAQVRPKSGLALNHGISLCNSVGTIDSGYRGEVCVIAINHGSEDFRIKKRMKIAQMVFNKFEEAEFQEADELDETKRNQGGFGSTGLE